MLREFVGLFSTPGLLPLLRTMGEATEMLLNRRSSAAVSGGAAAEVLASWLAAEGPSWRSAAEAMTPLKLYTAMEAMDSYLAAKAEAIQKK